MRSSTVGTSFQLHSSKVKTRAIADSLEDRTQQQTHLQWVLGVLLLCM
jgi:hypothetical protein